MRAILLVALSSPRAAASPSPQPPPTNGDTGSDVPSAHDTRTAIERRRDTACVGLAPRMTACAVEDAKKDLAAGKVSQKQFDADTSAEVRHKHAEKFIEKCEQQHLNSYQVRVYEVCARDEPDDCDALTACLQHVNDQK